MQPDRTVVRPIQLPAPGRFVEPEPDEAALSRRARLIHLAGAAVGFAAGIVYLVAG
jgi:hypothetical protein